MFNSTKVTNSPRTKNTDLYTNINETANGISRSFLQPKVTSTPLVKRDSIFATPPKHSMLSPRRYSLSEIATPPRQNRRDLTKVVTTGPLLASTKYNVNVSTYEDTKSPGLASRIVQYNEEAEREREQSRPPTHQAKYGSPGLFPVVHLFKKKLPVLEQKPKRVTIRIASPDYSRHHSQEYNRKLLEGIVKPSSPTFRTSPFSPSNQSSSTRSVLDALKEISRKRIHTNEEYDLNEDSGKRLRTMNNGDTNKRLRDESPLDKSPSPSKPTSKRVCMYDEYAASCSSTDFSFKTAERQEPKRKSISISTLTDNLKESKQIKLINAETQTVTTETVETTEQAKAPVEESQDKTEDKDESVGKKKSPLKIFDDAPLERIRKNRLAALMGSLTGKEPVLLPKPDYASVLNSQAENSDVPDAALPEVPKSTEKPLISILSSPKKSSPTKSNKHVHFRVPESTSQTNFDATPALSFPATSNSTLVTTTISETKQTFESSGKTSRATPAPPSSPVGLQPSSSDTATALPVITFGTGSNSSSTTSIVSKESSTSSIAVEAPKTGFSIPNFQFKPPTTPSVLNTPPSSTSTAQLTFSSAPAVSKPSATTSPPKMGGFKFDLSKPVVTSATATVSSAPTFSFGSTLHPNSKSGSDFANAVVPLTNTQSTAPEAFSFGVKAITTTAASSSNFALPFGATTTSSLGAAVSSAAAPTFTFGANGESKGAASAGFPLTHSNAMTFGVASTTTSSVPAFGTNTQASSVTTTSVPAFGTSKAPFFSFGASKTTSASSGFGAPPSTTSSAITFGAPSVTSSSFGTPTSSFLNTSAPLPAPNFGVVTAPSTLSGFGPPATTSSAGFGTNASSMFGPNKAVLPFGGSASTTPAFGTSSTTNSAPFGKSGAPQFGQSTTQPTFGAPTTTTSFVSANAFGAPPATTTSSSVFGVNNPSASVFGAKTGGFGAQSNNANIFGGPVNTQPSNFGTTVSKPMFGSAAAASPFATSTNTTTTPSFGSSNAPTFNFGAKTTASASFGTSNSFGTTTTTASTGFGNSTTPSFGTSNSFGGTNFGGGNAFGTTNTPAFGVATTSTQPAGFGVTTTPSFGTAGTGFNAVDKSPAFGSSSAAPAFGSNTASPFGTSTSNSFGTPSNTPGFGPNAAVSAFAKPQTTQNPFGAPNSNTFGTSNSFGATQPQVSSFGPSNPSTTQNAVFSFGATSPPKPPGVFSFGTGASNEVPKPTFNFTGGNTAPPAFGSSATPAFGGSGAAPFGAPVVPQFGAPQTGAQGMFSIGSGSSSGKARTHLKPKRRT